MHDEDVNPGHLDSANDLSGKVDSINFMCSIIRIRVDVFSERKLKMPVVGDHFQVNFPVDTCWIL